MVRVVVIKCLAELLRHGVTLFPTRELAKAGILKKDEARFVDQDEWLALHFIPGACIEDDMTWEEFDEVYNAVPGAFDNSEPEVLPHHYAFVAIHDSGSDSALERP